MQINADFTRPVTISAERYHWVPSTQPGVERMMLDRIGGEKARATTVVRYAANSSFPCHAHPGGEEILVLSGTFSDRSGDYPEGWYLRNPPASSHTPFSHQGATIFVKLWQMRPDDSQTLRVNTKDPKTGKYNTVERSVYYLLISMKQSVYRKCRCLMKCVI
ncbi:cupin domain-containing protein [Photobacterium leiognathi]|uniref:cupin domain-containing protein n=1 Tax=Photobacterium leiognathi TaxID=553611 RepID=UPI002735DEE1|nr:cupin domain-containing protein [Photobacterium leiognathi]